MGYNEQTIRELLTKNSLAGWLLFDFRRSNAVACEFLNLPHDMLLTRRFFYWIPAEGEPVKVVHAIESYALDHLPGKKKIYHSFDSLKTILQHLLHVGGYVAMEYSPGGAIPYISLVDGGTIDLVRSFGVQVVSSADILQQFTAVWTEASYKEHLKAANGLKKALKSTWEYVVHSLKQNQKVTEWDVQQHLLHLFKEYHLITDHPPVCAVNAHSADPHYCPQKDSASCIQKGDFILIDLWAKSDDPEGVYADMTQVAVVSDHVLSKHQEVFDAVKKGRDAALALLKDRIQQGKAVAGYELDRVCRKVISDLGYGENFIHRTGHSLGREVHGNGANIDDFETKDERLLLPGACFTIEPGVYLPGEFGVRLEQDIYIYPDRTGFEITTGVQETILMIQ